MKISIPGFVVNHIIQADLNDSNDNIKNRCRRFEALVSSYYLDEVKTVTKRSVVNQSMHTKVENGLVETGLLQYYC